LTDGDENRDLEYFNGNAGNILENVQTEDMKNDHWCPSPRRAPLVTWMPYAGCPRSYIIGTFPNAESNRNCTGKRAMDFTADTDCAMLG
jgi:hypothetical protein